MDQYNFYNQLFYVREELLDSLVQVTSGIRLYNMDCGKGGQGISNCKYSKLASYGCQ